jgi:hypothetical protein
MYLELLRLGEVFKHFCRLSQTFMVALVACDNSQSLFEIQTLTPALRQVPVYVQR